MLHTKVTFVRAVGRKPEDKEGHKGHGYDRESQYITGEHETPAQVEGEGQHRHAIFTHASRVDALYVPLGRLLVVRLEGAQVDSRWKRKLQVYLQWEILPRHVMKA